MNGNDPTPAQAPAIRHTGSLSRRMMLIATAWIGVLLLGGGIALDRTLTGLVSRNFDAQLSNLLNGMIASAEVGPDGEVILNRPLGDQRLLEPNSGLYWQIRGTGHDDFASRSLWDRSLDVKADHTDNEPHLYVSKQYKDEPLRVMERTVTLPGSETVWYFTVAEKQGNLDEQVGRVRRILLRSFAVLGLGLLVGLQREWVQKRVAGIRTFALSANGEKMLYRQGQQFFLTPATKAPPADGPLRLDTLQVLVRVHPAHVVQGVCNLPHSRNHLQQALHRTQLFHLLHRGQEVREVRIR